MVLRISVIGGGSFGTILANICASLGHETHLWMRDPELVKNIQQKRCNAKYLPELKLSTNLKATNDLIHAVRRARLLFLAIPSKAFGEICASIIPHVTAKQFLVSTTKGIDRQKFRLMSEIITEQLTQNQLNGQQQIGVLSGPNLAHELATKHLTGTVIASRNPELRQTVREALHTKYLHVFENEDMYGVELGGALKNIYAIAAGISDSLGFGMNTKSFLITRSAAEMARFATKLKANPMTFLGLAGIGDLTVTCNSPHSRNYRLGKQLISGQPIEEICASIGGVAEGVYTVQAVYNKAQQMDISMPIVKGVYRVVCGGERVKPVLWATLGEARHEDVEYLASS